MISLVVPHGEFGARIFHGDESDLGDVDIVFVSSGEENRLFDDVVLLGRNWGHGRQRYGNQ
jgi:hypothetical protein